MSRFTIQTSSDWFVVMRIEHHTKQRIDIEKLMKMRLEKRV